MYGINVLLDFFLENFQVYQFPSKFFSSSLLPTYKTIKIDNSRYVYYCIITTTSLEDPNTCARTRATFCTWAPRRPLCVRTRPWLWSATRWTCCWLKWPSAWTGWSNSPRRTRPRPCSAASITKWLAWWQWASAPPCGPSSCSWPSSSWRRCATR